MGESVLIAVFAAAFGLALGSFFNVCIYRLPRDLSVVTPRSFCPGCEVPISWWDNIPVVSFALLRGRCRHCKDTIPHRYWMVEVMTAIVLVACSLRFGLSVAGLKWAVFGCILVLLFWTDLESRILPDEITISGTILGLIFAFLVPIDSYVLAIFFPDMPTTVQSVVSAVAGSLILAGPIWIVSVLYERIRGRQGLGLGDVKLLLLLGAFLGFRDGIVALMLGSLAGSVIGVGQIVISHRRFSEHELPFGSFLCAGAAVVAVIRA